MAKFIGKVRGGRGEASRLGHKSIQTVAASWQGAVSVELREVEGHIIADVSLRQWHGGGVTKAIWQGRVDGQPGMPGPHEPVKVGYCPKCQHYGVDCTGGEG
jgi:hypothetical protein